MRYLLIVPSVVLYYAIGVVVNLLFDKLLEEETEHFNIKTDTLSVMLWPIYVFAILVGVTMGFIKGVIFSIIYRKTE